MLIGENMNGGRIMSYRPAINIASEIIRGYGEQGTGITNLKLQKVMYYADMMFLKERGEPLIIEDFEAWRHGPVIPEVYNIFKMYVSDPISLRDRNLETVELDANERDVINRIVDRTISIDAWDLVQLTHETDPWIDNYVPGCNFTIPKSEIRANGEINI